MKKLLLLIILVCSATICLGQSAKDELENGYKLDSAEKLFLHFSEEGKMRISADETFLNPLTFPDSSLFLVPNVGVNVYMRPVNPLKATTDQNISLIDDPTTEAAEKVLDTMLSLLPEQVLGEYASPEKTSPEIEKNEIDILQNEIKKIINSNKTIDSTQVELFKNIAALLESIETDVNSNSESINKNADFINAFEREAKSLKGEFDKINDLVQKKRQEEVRGLFTQLKELDFKNGEQTLKFLSELENKLTSLNDHYQKIDSLIKTERDHLKKRMVPLNYISGLMLNEMEEVKNGQFAKIEKFEQLLKMVKKYAEQAAARSDGVEWVVPLGDISAEKGKISTFSIELNSGKYIYDEEKDNITERPSTSLGKHSFRVKKFKKFVPEVAYGTAYTFIEYPVYGTTEDENGNQVVDQSGNERINNLNISGMINFNYFRSHSAIHPLIQVGLGINNEIPTLLTGGGIRVHINDTRFAISGGLAFTWVKKLNKLSEGDIVTGTAEIDEDLTYQFNWPPKPYVGFQFKF